MYKVGVGAGVVFSSGERERATSPFPVRGGDREGRTGLSIWGGIKVDDGKRGIGGFPLEEGQGAWHLEQSHR